MFHSLLRNLACVLVILAFGAQLACILPQYSNESGPANYKQNIDNPVNMPRTDFGPKKKFADEVDQRSPLSVETKEINQMLKAQNFVAIETAANAARQKQQRLTGGYWKLDAIYDALTSFFAEYKDQEITDEMWIERIETLNSWKKEMPGSITARVALAQAYVEYGWFARGDGFADTVTNENYALFEERLQKAKNELKESALGKKCPRWYREALIIGMDERWPGEIFDKMFDEAVHLWPNYLQFYLRKSDDLLPKWGGRPGEWQRWLNSIPTEMRKLNSDEADIIYFVVVANQLGDPSIDPRTISKEHIRKGFGDLDKKYGVDNLRLNQFASVACSTRDLRSAREAFTRIGDDWNKEVWEELTFGIYKEQALNPNPKVDYHWDKD